MTHSLLATDAATYEVLSVETAGIEKLSADIVVSRPIDRSELSRTARTLYRALKGSRFKRIFITWYLPGMEIGAGAWATTHFNPALKITIMTWMLEYNPPSAQIYAE